MAYFTLAAALDRFIRRAGLGGIAARLHSPAAGEEAALAASGIPLLLCAQFSYPFGLSLIQWAVLTLLLVTLDGRSRLNAGRFCRFVFARRETA